MGGDLGPVNSLGVVWKLRNGMENATTMNTKSSLRGAVTLRLAICVRFDHEQLHTSDPQCRGLVGSAFDDLQQHNDPDYGKCERRWTTYMEECRATLDPLMQALWFQGVHGDLRFYRCFTYPHALLTRRKFILTLHYADAMTLTPYSRFSISPMEVTSPEKPDDLGLHGKSKSLRDLRCQIPR
jgi:hypothetical protein